MNSLEELQNLPAINLLEDAGITLEGIQADMIADYEYAYEQFTGKSKTLYPMDKDRIPLNVCGGAIFQLYEFVQSTFRQNFIQYMSDSVLQNWGGNLGFRMNEAIAATATLEFGVNDILDFDVAIPAGTRATAGDGVYFATVQDVVIPAGQDKVSVSAACTDAGKIGNEYAVGQINVMADPVIYVSYVTNTSVSGGGEDRYSGDTLREKIFDFTSSYSVAGPKDAYIYQVKRYSAEIADVSVVTDDNATVCIYVMLQDGKVPDEAYCKGVLSYLKDLKAFPDTDRLSVRPPEVINYKINATYYISDLKADKKQLAVSMDAAVQSYIAYQYSRLGGYLNPNVLVEYARRAGIEGIDITSPGIRELSPHQIALCSEATLVYGEQK